MTIKLSRYAGPEPRAPTISVGEPAFSRPTPDIREITETAHLFDGIRDFVVIGNGGSITSFMAYRGALFDRTNNVRVFILDTMDPDLVEHVRRQCSVDDTLVVPISRSGNTIGVLELVRMFREYRMVVVTADPHGALMAIARQKGYRTLVAPMDIGGRFSGRTAAGYFPAALAGLDIERIERGARAAVELYCVPDTGNPAFALANDLYTLEQQGFVNLYTSFYSYRLDHFMPLFVQLTHETYGKEGKGLTVYGGQGPEAQHHTQQRLFGGRKDTSLLLITQKKREGKGELPEDELGGISIGETRLSELDPGDLDTALGCEWEGLLTTARDRGVPSFHLEVDAPGEEGVGELLVLLQYLTYYGALLRGVDPFDQPAVESSKKASIRLRRGAHQASGTTSP